MAVVPEIDQPSGFGNIPGLVGVDADLAIRPDRASNGREHLVLGFRIDSDFQIKATVSSVNRFAALLFEICRLALGQVAEIIDLVPQGATQQAVQRLPAVLATQIPQGLVDAGKGEVPGHGPVIPQSQAKKIASDGLRMPRIPADNKRFG